MFCSPIVEQQLFPYLYIPQGEHSDPVYSVAEQYLGFAVRVRGCLMIDVSELIPYASTIECLSYRESAVIVAYL